LLLRSGDDVARRLDRGAAVVTIGTMLLEPAMIAAQPPLDAQRRLVGAGIGVGRLPFGVQRDLRIQMNGAFGAKTEAFARHGDVPRIAAVEILAHHFGDPVADAPAQRLADVDILTGNAKRHVALRYVLYPTNPT